MQRIGKPEPSDDIRLIFIIEISDAVEIIFFFFGEGILLTFK